MSNLEKEVTTSQDGLLPRQKYHARTLDEHSSEAKLLTDATMKESKQAAGLRHWRSTNEFSELAIQNERTVVDGVEDLQTATTGLLARHHPELNLDPYDEKEEAKYNAKEAASRSSPTGRYPTIREPGDVSEVLSSSYVTAPANNSVDDRITPQTLKVLLKGSRQTVAKQLAKESHKKANYSYQASADQREKNAKMLRSTALAAKSEEVLTQNNYGNTYTEGTKGATLPRPGTGRRTPTPPPADIVPYYGNSEVNKGTTERVLNSVKYHEPPSITYAQSVKYHAGEEQEGFSQDTKLSSKPPPSNLTYPPTDYSESEELKKKAQAKSRLAPIQIPSRSSRPLKGSGTNREVLQQADALITEVEASRMVGNDTIELPPKSGKALGLDFAFTAATRGDDSSLVQQLVQYYTATRTKPGGPKKELTVDSLNALSKNTNSAPIEGDAVDVSVLDSVLSVSKEYEKVRQSSSNNNTASSLAQPDASHIAQMRQSIVKRLTSLDSTLIPEQFWVTIQDRAPQALARSANKTSHHNNSSATTAVGGPSGVRKDLNTMSAQATATRSMMESEGGTDSRLTSVVFPAANPVGRAQVYLLAETIDAMLSYDPRLLQILSDPEVATCILPEEKTASMGKYTPAEDPLLDPVLKHKSDEVFELYTNAADEVLQVLDAGFVELVRQTSAVCVERGALLDFLRQMLVDITASLIRVLSHTKKRTYREAEEKSELYAQMQQLRGQVVDMEKQISDLKDETKEMEAKNQKLVLKAARFDDLCERVTAKKLRFEVHEDDEHQVFLSELEKDMAKTANGALDTLYKENVRLRTGEEPPAAKTEAPSEKLAREAAAEEKRALKDLYDSSTSFLKSLRETTKSVDAACEPLYDGVLLGKMSAKANVASTRWAEVARSIGVHEKELTHRQRIFETFTKWCEAFQRDDANKTEEAKRRNKQKRDNEFLEDSNSEELEEVVDRLGTASEGESRPSFTTLPTSGQVLQGQRTKIQQSQWEEMQERRKNEVEEQDRKTKLALAEQNISTDLYEYGNTILRSIHYLTPEDLTSMGVTDCTAEEVNQLFERDFDFKAYLSPQWVPPKMELRLSDVVELLRESSLTLKEMSIRARAMAESAILKRGVEPPMQPPQYPEEACALCGRRDTSDDDKKKRQDKMQLLAKEIQKKVDHLTDKCQKAESEREAAATELKRVTADLELHIQREEELRSQLSLSSPQSNTSVRSALVTGGSKKTGSPRTTQRHSGQRRGSNRTSATTTPGSARRGSRRVSTDSTPGKRESSPRKREGKSFNTPPTASPNKETTLTSPIDPQMKGSSSIMKKTSSFARPKAGIAPSSPSPLESIPQSISPNGSMSLKTSLPPSVDESSLTASIKGPSLDPPRRRETMAKKESIKPLNSFKLPDDDE